MKSTSWENWVWSSKPFLLRFFQNSILYIFLLKNMNPFEFISTIHMKINVRSLLFHHHSRIYHIWKCSWYIWFIFISIYMIYIDLYNYCFFFSQWLQCWMALLAICGGFNSSRVLYWNVLIFLSPFKKVVATFPLHCLSRRIKYGNLEAENTTQQSFPTIRPNWVYWVILILSNSCHI